MCHKLAMARGVTIKMLVLIFVDLLYGADCNLKTIRKQKPTKLRWRIKGMNDANCWGTFDMTISLLIIQTCAYTFFVHWWLTVSVIHL